MDRYSRPSALITSAPFKGRGRYSDDEEDMGFGGRGGYGGGYGGGCGGGFGGFERSNPWRRSERQVVDLLLSETEEEKKKREEKKKDETKNDKPATGGPRVFNPRARFSRPHTMHESFRGRRSPSLDNYVNPFWAGTYPHPHPQPTQQPAKEEKKPEKEEKFHFKYEEDGEIRRFAITMVRGTVPFAKLYERIDLKGRRLYWQDDEGRVELSTLPDLETAIEYAKAMAEKTGKLPCVKLEIVDKRQKKADAKTEEKPAVEAPKLVHSPEDREKNRMQSELDYSKCGAVCDQCDCFVNSLNGGRYKCTVCADYDLCAKCAYEGHHKEHALLRVFSDKTRVDKSGLNFGAATPFMVVPKRFSHGNHFTHFRPPQFDAAKMAECSAKLAENVMNMNKKAYEDYAQFFEKNDLGKMWQKFMQDVKTATTPTTPTAPTEAEKPEEKEKKEEKAENTSTATPQEPAVEKKEEVPVQTTQPETLLQEEKEADKSIDSITTAESPDSDWSDAQEDLNEAKGNSLYPLLDLSEPTEQQPESSSHVKRTSPLQKEDMEMPTGDPVESSLLDDRLFRKMPVLLEFSALRELLSLRKRFRRERVGQMQSILTKWFIQSKVISLTRRGRNDDQLRKQLIEVARAFQPRLHSLAASFVYKDDSQVDRMLENRLYELRAIPDLVQYGSANAARIRQIRIQLIGEREDDRRRKEKAAKREARNCRRGHCEEAQEAYTDRTNSPARPSRPNLMGVLGSLAAELDTRLMGMYGGKPEERQQPEKKEETVMDPEVEVVEAVYLNPEQQKIFDQMLELNITEDTEMLLRAAQESRNIDEAVNKILQEIYN